MNNSEPNQRIGDSSHVLRYFGRSCWELDSYGVPQVRRDAFRESRKPISFNWLEFYHLDEPSSLVRICECHTHSNITKRGKFIKLQARDIRLTGVQRGVGFTIEPSPRSTNRSHASVSPSDKQAAHALYLCAKQYGSFLEVPEFRKIPTKKRKHCSDNSVETVVI